MADVHVVFDCKHEKDLDVSIDPDVEVPERVRGLGKCPDCTGELNAIPVSGVAPQADGRLIVDSVMMMPV